MNGAIMQNKLIVSQRSSRKLAPQVRQYLEASLSENTRRAYRNDLAHFLRWGGRIPATPECVASYLAVHAEQLSFATLSRRTVAIGRAHTLKRLPSPAHSAVVKATLQGIRRTNGSAQRRVTPARDLYRVRDIPLPAPPGRHEECALRAPRAARSERTSRR